MAGSMLRLSVLVATPLVFLAAFASSALAGDSRCRLVKPATLELNGPTDEGMLACVRPFAARPISRLVVNSTGGSVKVALDIAELLERPGLEVVVRRRCNSSCANYFIPLASRLVVETGAMILIHGGIDEAQLARVLDTKPALVAKKIDEGKTPAEAEQWYTALVESTRELVVRQRRFAERKRISPGWLLYRTAERPTTVADLDGDFIDPVAPDGEGKRFIMVEETMLRSCLPNVEVAPFQADLERTWLGKRWSSLSKQGIGRSAGARCLGRIGDWS